MKIKAVTITMKESQRYDIIRDLINGRVNGTEAAKQMNLSVRQVRRIKGRVKEKGIRGIAHGNRGKPGNQTFPKEKTKKIKKIVKEKYYDFKPTLTMEKLKENHQITISKEKLRNLMIQWGFWRPKSRKKSNKRHVWRQRKDNFGEMQQFDGSYHQWFGRAESCLLLSVDDATGKITHAKFDKNESVKAVFSFWVGYFNRNGLPLSIYLDKFSTYKINHPCAVNNSELLTQFQRAMNQAGVKPITAHSPQAKGRVERMFFTLQDRLVKELRLNNISTMDKANDFLIKFLPEFNAKFSVIPACKTDLHRKANNNLSQRLPQIFSIQSKRKVLNDYTVMFKKKFFQLEDEQPATVYKKDTVIIEEHLNGEIKINLKDHYLDYRILPERPKKMIDIKLPAITGKKSNYKPPINHPWRKFIFSRQKQQVLINN